MDIPIGNDNKLRIQKFYIRTGLQLIFFGLFGVGNSVHAEIMISKPFARKYANEKYMVTCKDNSGRQVEWFGPRGPLNAKSHPKVEVRYFGTSIIFDNLEVEDTGNYTCKAAQEEKISYLIVQRPLVFEDTSYIQTGKENSPATLRCEVKNQNTEEIPIITWTINEEDINDTRYKIIGDGLLITNVTRIDNKTFVCKAMQTSTGDYVERKIQLVVEHKPTFKSPLYAKSEEAWGFIGSNINLTCEVDAEPAPTFKWKWKKHLVDEELVYNVNSHKSILSIDIDDISLFGNYVCIAENKIGTLEKVFVLQQGIQAEPPDFIELRGANTDLLDIGIREHKRLEKIPFSQRPTGYTVEYKLITDEEWTSKDFDINKENSYPILELQPNTDYQIRAATRNKAGLSTFTEESIFKTLNSNIINNSGSTNQNMLGIFLLITFLALSIA